MAFRWRHSYFNIRIILSLSLVLMLFRYGPWFSTPTLHATQANTQTKQHELSLIIPASRAEGTLCKTLVSAAVLDFPSPLLVNFGKIFNDPRVPHNGGSHLGKITGILSQLHNFDAANDDQIMLVVDGLDTWFQLGPSVLLSRYEAINRRAYVRASQALCGRDSCHDIPRLAHVNQQIIFSAQKRCWPGEKDDIACLAPPPSTLPPDVYGPETDHIWPDKDYDQMKMRPKYLNSGFVMGPVAAMRRMFEDAERRMALDLHKGSDQGIFVEIFGEQEYARHLLRAAHVDHQFFPRRLWQGLFGLSTQYDSTNGKDMFFSATKLPLLDPKDENALRNLEYGISLDYLSEMSHTTVFSHRDADWIIHSQPERPSTHWHIVSPRVSTFEIPGDVLNMSTPHNVSDWYQMPLLTNLYTGVVPSSIHFNAWQHGMKSLMWAMWTHMWWHNASDAMISASIDGSDSDEATSGHTPTVGSSMAYTGRSVREYNIMLDNGTQMTLHQLCSGFFPMFELEVRLEKDKAY